MTVRMLNGFSVDTGKLTLEAQAVRRESATIEAVARRITACKNQIRITSVFTGSLKMQMQRLYDQALENAAQMDTLADALDEIARLYTDCENRLVNHANGIPTPPPSRTDASQSDEDKRSWWQRFLDWLFGRAVDTGFTHTSSEQEAAADARMQNQIQQLYGSDRFSEDTWANASVAERRTILQEFMREVAAIMGVDVTFTDIHEAPSNGLITNGWYNHSDREMAVNMYIVENYSAERSYSLMTTVVHELRHAYQHAAVDNPTQYQVSQATIDAWKDSFDHYRNTDGFMNDGMSQQEAYNAYRNQAVERDARWFAGQD